MVLTIGFLFFFSFYKDNLTVPFQPSIPHLISVLLPNILQEHKRTDRQIAIFLAFSFSLNVFSGCVYRSIVCFQGRGS